MKLKIYTANKNVKYENFIDFQTHSSSIVFFAISAGQKHPQRIYESINDFVRFALKHNDKYYTIFTYSPYVFTAINNMIAAHDAKADDLGIPLLNYDDVEAWELQPNGSLKSLKNDENRLLTCGDIDSVSEKTAILFDKILDRKYK